MMRTRRSRLPECRWTHVTLILTDDAGIRTINAGVFARAAVTDVITCRYAPIPGLGEGMEGELVVNLDRAVALARRNWPASRELALYIAHGCDHLAGADDATSAGAARMRRRELRWLREAAADGLLEGLIE